MISLFLTCTAVLFLQTRIAVWNDKNLPADAIPVIRSWPGTPRIVTNKMCDLLAKRYSCRAYFRVDILATMKADACRYMALYDFGGEYADLDVQFLKPLKNCTGLCVGHEYQPSDKRRDFANYFMAVGSANNSCLKKAVTLCCNRLASVAIDFVGSEQSTAFGTNLLRKGGKYIIVGLYGGELKLPLPLIPIMERGVQGSYTN